MFAKYLKVSKELGPTLKEAEAKKKIVPPEVIIKSLVKETEEMKAVLYSMMLLFNNPQSSIAQNLPKLRLGESIDDWLKFPLQDRLFRQVQQFLNLVPDDHNVQDESKPRFKDSQKSW